MSTAAPDRPRFVPAGLPVAGLVLRVGLFLIPCAALALAMPEVPHPVVLVLVVLCSAQWAVTPDHPAGAVAMLLVAGWWTVHDVVDWRVLVVGVLLVAAHVVATLLALGPPSLVLDRAVGVLWLRRGLLVLVPMPIAWLAVRGLDATFAPSWLWLSAALGTVALLVVTARLTQPARE